MAGREAGACGPGRPSAEWFVLDRLCLENEAPLACEVERVRAALGRVAGLPRSTGASNKGPLLATRSPS